MDKIFWLVIDILTLGFRSWYKHAKEVTMKKKHESTSLDITLRASDSEQQFLDKADQAIRYALKYQRNVRILIQGIPNDTSKSNKL